jgi:hypothetical protein
VLACAFGFTGCGPGLEFNSDVMSPAQMLERSTHVFIGVIKGHHFRQLASFRVAGDNTGYWKMLRSRVRIEAVLRGHATPGDADVYEIAWTSSATGSWNSTENGGRYLFLCVWRNGRYLVVRDWAASSKSGAGRTNACVR